MMQFHLNGFTPGDPRVAEPLAEDRRSAPVPPSQVDVLIVGCGPAGLTLAAQLAAFPDIVTGIVEQKDGPLTLGQADGIACRTMEMFEAFDFCEQVLREACWINEVTFWKPDDGQQGRIVRHGRVQDTEDGLSEFPHVVLNQARVHDFYLQRMRNSPRRLAPWYSRRVVGLAVDEGASDYPVNVRLRHGDPADEAGPAGTEETIRARYVVGCDGARSAVRKAIGRELVGDSANQAWGVMDMLAVTDFPDIRYKCAVQSDHGNLLVIPREGGYLVRLYVEMDKLAVDERVSNRGITLAHLVAAAQRILQPYTLDVKDVPWWSVYEIGQRICDRYDDVPARGAGRQLPRVFIAGDACHTHSPKAGQGMNVSMQDAFNLGWKLAAVLKGQADPALLQTYSSERQAVAQELIDFDREWARMFSDRPRSRDAADGGAVDSGLAGSGLAGSGLAGSGLAGSGLAGSDAADGGSVNGGTVDSAGADRSDGVDPREFQRYFERHGRFTAGLGTRYRPSIICADAPDPSLATGFVPGTRFHSAPVIRLADARPVHLGHVAKADGRWRLYAFAGRNDDQDDEAGVRALCRFLQEAASSPLRRYTRPDEDPDARIDLRAIFQQGHRELAIESLPALLRPRKGRYRLVDSEKVFCAPLRDAPDIYAQRGIDREQGALVIVRPDQYIAQVLPLGAHDALARFFSAFLLPHHFPAGATRRR